MKIRVEFAHTRDLWQVVGEPTRLESALPIK